MAEIVKSRGQAIAALRQEGVISVNEARLMLGYEVLENPEASDPFYLSPKLSINKGKDESGDSEEVITVDNEDGEDSVTDSDGDE